MKHKQPGRLGIAALALLLLGGSVALLENTVVRDTLPDGGGWFGRAVGIQYEPLTLNPARATLRGVLIENSHDAGVFVYGSDATIESTVVSNTSDVEPSRFGDGVVALTDSPAPTRVHVRNTIVRASARAGVASFGSEVLLEGSVLECNPIHLNGEQHYGLYGSFITFPYSFADLGNNECGCEAVPDDCVVLSTGLEPPAPVEQTASP